MTDLKGKTALVTAGFVHGVTLAVDGGRVAT